ncbi:hypothetical protein HB162lentus_22390 [Mammaliicoccus lentus]|uniref:DUF6731 family protein n=1 Tax=unclassified Mammaliicoccus TaxID=2803851 RepID=UPI001EFB9896|nr:MULTISPECIES: DUF6731 family protein [unclassified Mammaliicoccus]
MAKNKIVRFNFLRPIKEEFDRDDVEYELTDLFTIIENQYKDCKSEVIKAKKKKKPKEYVSRISNYFYTYEHAGNKIKLGYVNHDLDNKYFHLVFEKFDYQLYELSKESGESRIIDAEDDEYIGYKISCLYDPANACLIIQRGVNAVGIKAIEGFINKLIDLVLNIEIKLRLDAILEKNTTKKALNQSVYRSIGIQVSRTQAQNIVRELFKKEINGVYSVELTLKTENKKTAEIDSEDMKEIINTYTNMIAKDTYDKNSSSELEKLIVRAREEEDSSVQSIDLISNKIQAIIDVNISEERLISQSGIYDRMVSFYRLQDKPFNRLVR